MESPTEFHYRLPGRIGGQRPGSHPGSSLGSGLEFVAHRNLYDYPDPRRLDLRASLRTLTEDWLVRVNRQRAGTAVRALVDVSASMSFGGQRPKLHVVADFVEALGMSAFRVGDAVGMMAFDVAERTDLFMPARVSRGMGSIMGEALRELSDGARGARGPTRSARVEHELRGTQTGRDSHGPELRTQARRDAVRAAHGARAGRDAAGAAHGARPAGELGASDGLEEAASRLAGQQGLVFLISDFHWPLARLDSALDLMAHATVIPIVIWDAAETEPPTRNALASLSDMESGARRTLWLRPKLRDEWRQGVARRRSEIDSYFNAHTIRPFYMEGRFDADALSRYFFEADL